MMVLYSKKVYELSKEKVFKAFLLKKRLLIDVQRHMIKKIRCKGLDKFSFRCKNLYFRALLRKVAEK